MIDTLVALEDRIRERGAARAAGVEPGSFLLVTLHRPALVDGPLLAEAIAALGAGGGRDARSSSRSTRGPARCWASMRAAAVTLTDPVGYLDFLSLEADAAAVLTDSGGIQEETTYLGVPCFTLRDNTERPVTVRAGTNTLLGLAPERIAEIPELLAAAPAERAATTGEMGRPRGSRALADALAAGRFARRGAALARSAATASSSTSSTGPARTRSMRRGC